MASGSVKTFSCPNCGGSVAIRAVGISVTAVCQNCASIIDVANENFKIIDNAKHKLRDTTIAIGARATLFEVEWEVIGYVIRQTRDAFDGYSWEEYLLFNPWQGFRFLVCADDHWTLVKTIHQDIEYSGARRISCDGQEYKLFSQDVATVSYVIGEFYWRVKVGEKTTITDFIAPPNILSKEENDDEVVWSQGIYLEKEIIEQAFGVQLEEPQGIAPNQPSPFAEQLPELWKTFAVFLAGLFLMQFVITSYAENKTVFSQQVQTRPEHKGQVFSSEPFELTGNKANVELTVSSPVNNNWLELNTSLVHETTQESFDSSQEVSYYQGYDSDGAWSEGKQQNQAIISAVPAGKYHLLLTPDAGAYNQSLPVDFNITVKRDVTILSNFFVALFAMLLYPLIIWARHSYFEKSRWADSDYVPSGSSNDSNKTSNYNTTSDTIGSVAAEVIGDIIDIL